MSEDVPDISLEQPLRVEIDRRGDIAVARIGGSVTMEVCDDLRRTLLSLAAEPFSILILELSAVDFICSEGLGAFVAVYLKTVKRGGAFRLAKPSAPIVQLLGVTRLDSLFSVFPSVAAASEA
jgi:anti-sigma B factor antagonist